MNCKPGVDPLYEDTARLLRDLLKLAFKSAYTTNIASLVKNLAEKDQMKSSLELGMKDGIFTSSQYWDDLESSPNGVKYINRLLSDFISTESKEDRSYFMPPSETAFVFALPGAFDMILQHLHDHSQKNHTPFSMELFHSDLPSLHLLLSSIESEFQKIEEEKLFSRCFRVSWKNKSPRIEAFNHSLTLIPKLVEDWIAEGKLLKEAGAGLDVMDLYLENVDVFSLIALMNDERSSVLTASYSSNLGYDLRGYCGQVVRQAVALTKDPSLFPYLPCKVIEFKDYIPNFTATKWTETFKKRLRRARAEAEKRRAAPGPLRLKEFILPVNDIDE